MSYQPPPDLSGTSIVPDPKIFYFERGNYLFDHFFFLFIFFVLAKGIKTYGLNVVMNNIDRIFQRLIEFARIHPLSSLAIVGLSVDVVKDLIYPTVDVASTVFGIPTLFAGGAANRIPAPLSLALAEDLQVWADRIYTAFGIQQFKEFSTAMSDILKSVSPIITGVSAPAKITETFYKTGQIKSKMVK